MTQRVSSRSERWIPIGRIVKPHGLTGEVLVRPYNPDSSVMACVRRVRIDPDGVIVDVVGVRAFARGFGLQLAGIIDRDGALALANKEIASQRVDWETPPAGQYYVDDLVGFRVIGLPNGLEGVVTEILPYAGHPNALVALSNPGADAHGQLEIPCVAPILTAVDPDAGTLSVTLPEGFMELAQWK